MNYENKKIKKTQILVYSTGSLVLTISVYRPGSYTCFNGVRGQTSRAVRCVTLWSLVPVDAVRRGRCDGARPSRRYITGPPVCTSPHKHSHTRHNSKTRHHAASGTCKLSKTPYQRWHLETVTIAWSLHLPLNRPLQPSKLI